MTKRYSNFDRDFDRLAKGAVIAWITWVLICLGLAIGVIYVAIHFIAKYW
jgi:hypothetical protein